MSYFGERYPFYVPPFISGTERVKMSTMKVTTMTEMEQHIKARYNFAMSSFSRMYGVSHVSSNKEIFKFCNKWANTKEEPIPVGTLTSVDFYFRDLWKTWGGYL